MHQASNFCTPTSLQVATAVAFDAAERDGYFAEFATFLELKRNKLVALLRTAQLDPIVPQGGYFLLADTTKIAVPTNYPLWEAPEDIPLEERRDFAVCRLLTEKVRRAPLSWFRRPASFAPHRASSRALGRAQAGVTALPASAFYSEGHRHITDSLARFCFVPTS